MSNVEGWQFNHEVTYEEEQRYLKTNPDLKNTLDALAAGLSGESGLVSDIINEEGVSKDKFNYSIDGCCVLTFRIDENTKLSYHLKPCIYKRQTSS